MRIKNAAPKTLYLLGGPRSLAPLSTQCNCLHVADVPEAASGAESGGGGLRRQRRRHRVRTLEAFDGAREPGGPGTGRLRRLWLPKARGGGGTVYRTCATGDGGRAAARAHVAVPVLAAVRPVVARKVHGACRTAGDPGPKRPWPVRPVRMPGDRGRPTGRNGRRTRVGRARREKGLLSSTTASIR